MGVVVGGVGGDAVGDGTGLNVEHSCSQWTLTVFHPR